MKTPIPAPDRAELVRMRQQGLTREQIAEHFGVALSRVKRWIKELNVPPDGFIRKEKIQHSEGEVLTIDHGLTLVERAKNVLGPRMVEDRNRGYLLDGRPVRVDILIRAAGLEVPVKR